MVLNWFFRDEFEQFYSRVERLQKFLRIAEREWLIDHFVELRRHFRKMKMLLPELTRSYQKESETINHLPESEYKEKLETFSAEVSEEIRDLEGLVNTALVLVEDVLKIRVIKQVNEQKDKLKIIIDKITNILIKAQQNSFELIKLEKAWKKAVKRAHKKQITKIRVVGKLNNGWRLSDIQDVVIELGGVVLPNRGGNHPYKIVFPKHRAIPLAASTPPLMLVKEVASATRIDSKRLVVCFSQGELIAA
jgi:hypothetical protein